jgi:hypothetical protein
VKENKDAWSSATVGKMPRWGGEVWLDIYELDMLKLLMTPRIKMAAAKGCSAVEPDNSDCFTNPTECKVAGTLTDKRKAQLAYNTWTAETAHASGMLCALKNTKELANDLAAVHDFSIAEQCQQYNDCNLFVYSRWLHANFNSISIGHSSLRRKALSRLSIPQLLSVSMFSRLSP